MSIEEREGERGGTEKRVKKRETDFNQKHYTDKRLITACLVGR